MNFTDIDLLAGVMRTLKASGRALELVDYVSQRKEGEVNAAKIAANF